MQIATIAIGLLLAVSLERIAEAVSWHVRVAGARDRLNAEIANSLAVYVHRDDVARCVERNLLALTATLHDLQSGKPAAVVPPFVSPENGPIRTVIWKSLVAAQVIPHFPSTELELYANFYFYVDEVEYFMDRESRAWRQLHLLEGDPNQLTKQDVSNLRVAASEVQEISPIVAQLSKRQIEVARALGVEVPKPNASWRKECGPAH